MRRRLSPVLLALFAATAARAATPHPYVAPWLTVLPGDARIARIANLPLAAHSPNAAGVLLTLGAPAWSGGRAASAGSVRELAEHAHGAGWRWGLKLDLPEAAVPADVRAAEAATVEDLWPGLGEILREARTADLVVIAFAGPAVATRRRARIFLERWLRALALRRRTRESHSKRLPAPRAIS